MGRSRRGGRETGTGGQRPHRPLERRQARSLVYGLLGLVYTTVTLVARYGHWRHDRAWVTTPRSTLAGAAANHPAVLATASCASQSNNP
ncbi:MAG: hypothetical protein JO250_24355 [Armatimonadetes bacterium]|nr:hypothetical protein [Armatimonadota bacterium]